MFGFIKDLGNGLGSLVGTIIAVPLAVIAETLDMSLSMVKEAKDAGCETYDEIREYWK